MLRRLAPLAAALVLAAVSSTPVWAGIALSVGGAEAEFGAGVTRVHGRATDETAFVGVGPSPCLTAVGCTILNSNAVTNADFDATQARWRVEGYAIGANAGTSVELLVTDLLTLAGLPNATVQLNFSVRVELDELYATPGTNGGADAWYGFELGTMQATEGPPEFQPFFSLLAEEHHYDGYPSQKSFIAPGILATEIPSSYETTVSIPVFLGPSGRGSFDIALHSYADTAVQGGVAGVKSFNSAYLGLSATDASITSANGYGYLGYQAAQVPEPPIHLLTLAGLGLLGATRRRRLT